MSITDQFWQCCRLTARLPLLRSRPQRHGRQGGAFGGRHAVRLFGVTNHAPALSHYLALTALCVAGFAGAPVLAQDVQNASSRDSSDAALLAEVRHAFTLHGKPVPPEIFRDMGDGDLGDSGAIWVTVDIVAAIGSELYGDPIKQEHGWVIQTKPNESMNHIERTDYTFVGSTSNGLLVVLASYSGGGSGTFYTLHVLDVAAARGFGIDGKIYRRINLTDLRNVILGDRWVGDIIIAKNSIRITTTRDGPVGGPRPSITIEAKRP
jgi:hypothetical protein